MKKVCISKQKKCWQLNSLSGSFWISRILGVGLFLFSTIGIGQDKNGVNIIVKQTGTGGEIVFSWQEPILVEDNIKASQLFLLFNKPLGKVNIQNIAKQLPNLIRNINYGYDSVLMVLKYDVISVVHVQEHRVTVKLLAPQKKSHIFANNKSDLKKSEERRKDYLQALVLIKFGKYQQANKYLTTLVKEDPQNPDYQQVLAELELRLGKWQNSLIRYNEILKNYPEKLDVLSQKQQVMREYGNRISISSNMQNISGSGKTQYSEINSTLNYKKNWKFTLALENRRLDLKQVQHSNGLLIDFRGNKNYAQLGLENYYPDSGYQYGAYFSEENIGARFHYYGGPPYSRIKLGIGYHEYYLDYAEAVINKATQDFLEVNYFKQYLAKLDTQYHLAYKRYNIDINKSVTRSLFLQGRLRYHMKPQGYHVFIGYQFEAEYAEDAKGWIGPLGKPFFPLVIASREMHTLEVLVQGKIRKSFHYHTNVGYLYDRLNAHAPFFGISLLYLPKSNLSFGVKLYNSLAFQRGSNRRVNEVGLFLNYYLF